MTTRTNIDLENKRLDNMNTTLKTDSEAHMLRKDKQFLLH
jgi:hypothetical protein